MLRYMVSDTDLAKGQALEPKHRVVESKAPVVKSKGQNSQPKKGVSSTRKIRRFCLLLVACVVVWTLVYDLWAGEESNRFWTTRMADIFKMNVFKTNILTTNKGLVTGIIYNAENPSAIVCGEVVREGESINGYKVVEIYKQEVVLEKNGRSFTAQVH